MTSRALTGLRGVAAITIVLHHAALHLPELGGNTVLLQAYLAVDLFFVLSGFVMALGYGTWFRDRQTAQEYWLFLSRRVARVWPLHTVLVVLLLLDGLARHTGEYWPRMAVANLLLMQSWGFSQTAIAPAWSVSTEMLAYVLFPLLSGMALRSQPRAAWYALGIAVAALVVCVVAAPDRGAAQRGTLDLHQNWSLLPALRCLAGFTIGLLTWRALQARAAARFAAHPATALGAGFAVIVLLVGRAPDGLVYLCFPVLVAGLYAGTGKLTRWLATAPVYWLGTLSYALYLIHVPVLDRTALWAPGDTLSRLALFALLLIPATFVAHFGVERPAQIVLRRTAERLLRPRRVLPAA